MKLLRCEPFTQTVTALSLKVKCFFVPSQMIICTYKTAAIAQNHDAEAKQKKITKKKSVQVSDQSSCKVRKFFLYALS